MKKFVFCLCLLLLAALMLAPAFAEGLSPTPEPTDFFTWATIGTFAGAVAMTVFIVQAVKMPLDKVFHHVPTRLVVYCIALALLLMSQAFLNGGLTFENVCLAVINAFLVMLSAMSTYTLLIEQKEARKFADKLIVASGKTEDQETDPPSDPAVTEE